MASPICFLSKPSKDLEKDIGLSGNNSIRALITARILQFLGSVVAVGLAFFLRVRATDFSFQSTDTHSHRLLNPDVYTICIHGSVLIWLVVEFGSFLYRGTGKDAFIQAEASAVAKAVNLLLALLLLIAAIMELISVATNINVSGVLVWGVEIALGLDDVNRGAAVFLERPL